MKQESCCHSCIAKGIFLCKKAPTSGNAQWWDIEAMFAEMGAEVTEREGSRVAIVLFDEVRVFHRPHPSPNTDKGAVVSIRKWLEQHGVKP